MIWLLRHAQTENAAGRYIGSTDLPLSLEGKAQAAILAQAMAGQGPKAIYSSPLRRALDTAAPLARACGVTVVSLVPELSEIHLGAWEGLAMETVRREQPEAHMARGLDFAGFRPPGGESFGDVSERSLRGLNKLAEGPQPCACVTHAGIIRVLLCHVHGLDLNELFRFKPEPVHAWALERDNGRWALHHENLSPEVLAQGNKK